MPMRRSSDLCLQFLAVFLPSRNDSSDWLSPGNTFRTYSGGTVWDLHPIILFSKAGHTPALPRKGVLTCNDSIALKTYAVKKDKPEFAERLTVAAGVGYNRKKREEAGP